MYKEIKMKKIILLLALGLWSGNAAAQMSDALGTLLIDEELSNEGYQSVTQGQRALNRMRFQQDLGNLVATVQTTYFGNYAGLSKAGLDFNGFSGISWDIKPSDDGGFYIDFDGLDGATCFICQGGTGAKRAEINNGEGCGQSGNKVKLFF